jgi:hypothetical protein
VKRRKRKKNGWTGGDKWDTKPENGCIRKSCDVMRDSESEIIPAMNAFYPQIL